MTRRTITWLAASVALLAYGPAWAENLAAPPSLKRVAVPEPPNLGEFLRSDPNVMNQAGYPTPTAAARQAAIVLGKALFWDQQVGSDGQACASCHFHAGVDNRKQNTVSPGLKSGDTTFQVVGPNGTLTSAMFPFTQFANPDDRFSSILRDTNDVIGPQGAHLTDFVAIAKHGSTDVGVSQFDPVFSVSGINTRRVEPRNPPSVINAVFNFANFWDGRANNVFNGANPFGDSDPDAGVYVNVNGAPQKVRIRIPMASLASQAVGPPGSDFEMSFSGRSFSDIGRKLNANIGKKMVTRTPLALQKVHPNDSVLGPYSNAHLNPQGTTVGLAGFGGTYLGLIQAAFQDKYWNSSNPVVFDDGQTFNQVEANFALFFGLAVQLYEATLVSDDSPFDRFQDGNASAMSFSAQSGLNIFLKAVEPGESGGSCINCHGGSEFTNASVSHVGVTNFGASLPEGLIELMQMATGAPPSAFYDSGYYNIGVRPTEEDPGRGDTDPFGFPLSFTGRALLKASGVQLPFANPDLPCGIPGAPPSCPSQSRGAVAGAFKAPTLRNVELTGPYMHNGGKATLRQVVDFYTRGGDFHERNLSNLDPDIQTIEGQAGNEAAKNALVDFLLSLTDERVRWEKAPFDHPELFVPNGTPLAPDGTLLTCGTDKSNSCDTMLRIPPVGAGGLAAEGLPPLGTFLGIDPHQP